MNPGFDLDNWPLYTPEQASYEPHGRIIRTIKMTGYRKLGFAIVRGTYDDQSAWDRLITRIRQTAFSYLGIRQELLARFLDFPILEADDRDEPGANLSLDEARDLFRRWSRSATTDDGDGPGATKAQDLPRFHHFIYVDQTSLDSLVEREACETENPEVADLWVRGPSCFVTLVRAEQEQPNNGSSTISEADLPAIRQQAQEMAASDPLRAEAVMQQLAIVEAAAWSGPGVAPQVGEISTVETASGEEHESDEESVSSSFFHQDPEWFYVQMDVLLGMYENLHDRSSWWMWCARPPGVYKG